MREKEASATCYEHSSTQPEGTDHEGAVTVQGCPWVP